MRQRSTEVITEGSRQLSLHVQELEALDALSDDGIVRVIGYCGTVVVVVGLALTQVMRANLDLTISEMESLDAAEADVWDELIFAAITGGFLIGLAIT